MITRANQAWSIDITYIRLNHGLYIDSNHRLVQPMYCGWDIDDTLATPMVLRALDKAFAIAKPLILNSDQGSQFTSSEYIETLKKKQYTDQHGRQEPVG